MTMIDRRHFLALCAATATWPYTRAALAGTKAPRIVALEWRYADHARSLGITPVGIADLAEYRRQYSTDDTALEAIGTLNMGRRQEPSLEAIIAAKPDIILGVNFRHERIRAQLSQIAETVLYQYTQTGTGDNDQLALMLDELRDLGNKIGRDAKAGSAQAELDQFIAEKAAGLSAKGITGPIVFAQFPAGVNNVRLFTQNALPVRLLDRIGLANAWHGKSEGYGFTTVGPEALLGLGDVTFLGVAIGPDNSYSRLEKNPLWKSLPFVRANRFHALTDVVWPFGGIPAAHAFIGQVTEVLLQS